MVPMTDEELRAIIHKSVETIGLTRTAKLLELAPETTLKIGGGFKTTPKTVTHAKAYAHRLPKAA
jgi:hypothetical protein